MMEALPLTADRFRRIMPNASQARVNEILPHLVDAMEEYGINTPQRQAAFLAQLAHESGSLRYVREIASGDAYEGRANLGNFEAGDGRRFKGRGLIQITGRANYAQCALALGLPLLQKPEILEQPGPSCRSAAWFWHTHGLNALADQDNFLQITKVINGGLNGYDDRCDHWAKAKAVLCA